MTPITFLITTYLIMLWRFIDVVDRRLDINTEQ